MRLRRFGLIVLLILTVMLVALAFVILMMQPFISRSIVRYSSMYPFRTGFSPVLTGSIDAVQLNYSVDDAVYFSAREPYAWISRWRGGADPPFSGERVAGHPLNRPLNDPLAPNNKTYAYRICLDTFPPDMNDQADWQEMTENALEQWESAVPDYVTMSLVTHEAGTPDAGKSKPCANNKPVIRAKKDRIDAEYAASLANQIDTSTIREFVTGLGIHTRFVEADNELNEVMLVQLDESSSDVRVLAFNELSDLAGLDCFTGGGGDPVACVHSPKGVSTADILIKYSVARGGPLTQPVQFNTCLTDNSKQHTFWSAVLHEGGHVLGIHRGTDGVGQERHHPKIDESIVIHTGSNKRKCYPTPFDIMAITALFQSIP